MIMSLKKISTIAIPGSAGSAFDHGAFDPATRRVFVAHTGQSCVEVIDHDAGKHVATLPDFPEAAGVVADDGMLLVTNRGAASLAWVDARSLKTQRVFNVGTRPNGVAIVARQKLAIAACIGDDSHRPTLHAVGLDGGAHHTIELPGRPRWCVTDASAIATAETAEGRLNSVVQQVNACFGEGWWINDQVRTSLQYVVLHHPVGLATMTISTDEDRKNVHVVRLIMFLARC